MTKHALRTDSTTRGLAWVAIGLLACGVIVVLISAVSGGPVRWWELTQPTILIAMVAHNTFGQLRHAPRFSRRFNIFSCGVALMGLIALLMSFRE